TRFWFQAIRGAHEGDRSETAARHGEQGAYAKVAGGDRAGHHLVCALWFSRVACGQLRFDCLRQRLLEVSLPRRVYGGNSKQPADGFLSTVYPRQGCATTWTDSQTGGCNAIGVVVHDRRRKPKVQCPMSKVRRIRSSA